MPELPQLKPTRTLGVKPSPNPGKTFKLNDRVYGFDMPIHNKKSQMIIQKYCQIEEKEIERKMKAKKARQSQQQIVFDLFPAKSRGVLAVSSLAEDAKAKLVMDLDSVLKREDRLSAVVDALKADGAFEFEAAAWWDFTRRHGLNSLPRLLKEERNKKNARIALVLEQVAVTAARALLGGGEQAPGTLHALKNILYYVHQNFLVLLDILYGKIPPQQLDSVHAAQLEATVQSKRARRTKNGENFFFLKQNNDMISSFLRTLLKSKAVTSQRRTLGQIPGPAPQFNRSAVVAACALVLKNLDKNSLTDVRESLEEALEAKVPQQDQHHATSALQDLAAAAQEFFGTLPQVEAPYLPRLAPEEESSIYTLVLDLDETLIHYSEMGGEGYFRERPGVHRFLHELALLYELVIFTAGLQDYADWVLDQLDQKGLIRYRLYRQHASPTGMYFVKDLSRLGRDLSRTIIVDNTAENF